MKNNAIVWFRNDLRVHDNEALHQASIIADKVLPVYVFDERVFKGKTSYGFAKTGPFRAQFIIESVHNLRQNLQRIGLDLCIMVGKPEQLIMELADKYKVSWVIANRERTDEEVKTQDALERNLWSKGMEMIYTRGKMLYYTSDFPFPISQTPDNFTTFRKEVEKFIPIRKPLETPVFDSEQLIDFNDNWGKTPTLKDFGHDHPIDLQLKGGEDEALNHLQYYLWDTDLIKNYKETRNQLLGRDFSTKFSAYLSQGCLSPKMVYHEVKRYEHERTANESTYWVIFELLWRDYFRLIGKKYGNKIFQSKGIFPKKGLATDVDLKKFKIWAEGKTGIPFIDANMQELNKTGFMSNRGRQNVASFLVKDLKINWLLGAEYFESLLLDYDPCSNYGNWCYITGIGNDPREDRYFNIMSQAFRYDEDGSYVKHWIPVLERLPAPFYHTPDAMTPNQQREFGLIIGKDYPKSLIPTSKWKY